MPPTMDPSYVFEADLGAADCKRYIPLAFDVPPGRRELHIDLQYEPLHVGGPKEIHNQLGITLFDPLGFRGSKHSGDNHKPVSIGPLQATPGFRPGPLPAGRWVLQLDTHLVLPGVPLSYRVAIRLAAGAKAAEAPHTWRPQPVLRHESGWYRGDLHTHTLHSDGRQTVPQLLDSARGAGLDFLALTDHNAVEPIHDPAALACHDLALIPGMELTTYHGHALSLGTTQWIDWRTGHQGRTMGDCAEEIRAAGGLSVIAHLAALGDPLCTGCSWLYTDQMPGAMQAIEVWNGAWYEMGTNSPITLHIWYEWLSRGLRIPATAGTDTHDATRYSQRPPFSVVHARELSAEGILDGVRQGHVLLSVGPEVRLEATLSDGQTAIMGDIVQRDALDALSLRWQGAPEDAVLRWVAGGELAGEWRGASGAVSPPLPEGARWVVAELRAKDGAMLALTNPLYITG